MLPNARRSLPTRISPPRMTSCEVLVLGKQNWAFAQRDALHNPFVGERNGGIGHCSANLLTL
jgi:hypothetical protein